VRGEMQPSRYRIAMELQLSLNFNAILIILAAHGDFAAGPRWPERVS
jgi:hypothetical protein